jgi:hypothetical protein
MSEQKLKSLISFINASSTSIAKETFYNTKDEQTSSLAKIHSDALNASRAFYALMLLSQSATDENKKLIVLNLLENTEASLEQKSWENALMLQTFSKMQPNRVFDIFNYLVDMKVNNSRTRNLILEFLKRNLKSLSLWSIKYKRQLRRIIRHAHIYSDLHIAIKFISSRNLTENILEDDLLNDYLRTKDFNDLDALYRLPLTIARGFAEKYKINKSVFLKTFAEKGKLTQKESRQQTAEFRTEGVDTHIDPTKLSLFDLYIYLDSLTTLPAEAEEYVEIAAKRQAKNIAYRFDDVAVILDTSLSMSGTEQTKKHPIFRSLAFSALMKELSNKYVEYRLNKIPTFIPRLTAETNYADAILEALKAKHHYIFIIGDGYENCAYEGLSNEIVSIFRRKIDKKHKTIFAHFNPVFAAEVKKPRSLFLEDSDLEAIGIRDEKSLSSALFLAICKGDMKKALVGFLLRLLSSQNEEARILLPENLKLIEKRIISNETEVELSEVMSSPV